MLSPLTSAHCVKIVTMHQNVGLQAFMEEVAGRSHASGKSSRLQHLSIMFSPPLGQHPKIRTSSFAVSRTRLAALPWDPRLTIGHGRRELHLRKSVLDSHLQWRSGKGPHLETRLPDTQHWVATRTVSSGGVAEKIFSTPFMAHLRTHQTRTVTWGFGASFVGVDPLEANWVASCSRPCFRFSGVLVHLHVPQILRFLLATIFDLVLDSLVRP